MAIAASSASSATSSLMAQTLSLRRAIKAGLCPLASIICTYCMLFKYKDKVYTKHRHIFWLPWYSSSIFAGCTRYPFFPIPRGVLRSRCRFSGSLPMCQWIDMQMPRTWYWKCRRHFYIHCRGMCIFIHVCFVITAALRTGCYPCTHPHTLTNWKSI